MSSQTAKKHNTKIAAGVTLLAGLFVMSPFLDGSRALFPFHTGSLEPFSSTSPEWSRKDHAPANFVVGDKHTIIYPDLMVTLDAWRAGRLPLWNAANFAGLPHAANPLTATFYPPNVLFLLFDPFLGFALLNALHLMMLCFFMRCYLRHLEISEPWAILGGLCTAFSGWVAVHIHHSYFVHAFTWLPAGLLAIEGSLRLNRRRDPVIFALAVAMSFLAGFPQTAVINTWVWLAYALSACPSALRRLGLKTALRRYVMLGTFAALGLGLAGVQLLPTFDYLKDAGHQNHEIQHLKGDALAPGALWTLLSPEILGAPHDERSEADRFFALWALHDPDRPSVTFINNHSERTFFGGTLVMLLALSALFFRRTHAAVFFTLAGAAGVALAMATPLLDLFYHLPGFNFGSPMRNTQVTALAFPVLFAVAIDALDRRQGPSAGLRFFSVILALGVLLPLSTLVLTLWIGPEFSAETFGRWIKSSGLADRLGAGALPLDELIRGLKTPLDRVRHVLLIVLAVWFGVVFFLGYCSRGRIPRLLMIVVLGLLTLPELVFYTWRFNRPVPREGLYTTAAPGIDYLRESAPSGRLIRFDGGRNVPLLLPNAAQAFGLQDSQGFRALAPLSFLNYMRGVEANPFDFGIPNLSSPESLKSPLLAPAGITSLITPEPAPELPWPRVFPPPGNSVGMVIFENPIRLDAAYFCDEVRILPKDEVAPFLRSLRLESTDPLQHPLRRTMVINADEAGDIRSVAADRSGLKVALHRPFPERIEIEIPDGAEGPLFVSEQFSRHWHAEAEFADTSREMSVVLANSTFMSVMVEKGTRRVIFRYSPDVQWYGFGLSAFAAAVIVWHLVKRRKPHVP